jgi:hypothetical protein
VMLNNESSIWYIQPIYTNPEKTKNSQKMTLVCYRFGSTNVNEISVL